MPRLLAASISIRSKVSDLLKEIEDSAKAELKLRSEVKIYDKGSLPNDGLVIEDTRTYE